ncbi:putative Sel1 repeat family protein [Pelagibacter phage Greip EXVC021P]|jgi:hypothetical protein|nr:putative Sel1 repeat family protein [Pelagibacter phage Greip EXVC021P]
MLSNYETWYKKANSGDTITYYDKGYLARQRFFDNNLRDIANYFMRLAEAKKVNLFQKRLAYGSPSKDPVFQYIAQKI